MLHMLESRTSAEVHLLLYLLVITTASGYHLLSPALLDATEACEAEKLPAGMWMQDANLQGRKLIGTAFAQNHIWRLQNPTTCGPDVKGLVFQEEGAGNGIGSMIHILGVALATSVHLGRTLVLGRDASFGWDHGQLCRRNSSGGIDTCWFSPLSTCTRRHFAPLKGLPPYSTREDQRHLKAVEFQYPAHIGEARATVPAVFHALLKASGIPEKRWYYWWRAQAAAYVVRFPPKVQAYLNHLQGQIHPGGPVSPGTISLHIRRGDKIIEVKNPCTDEQFLECVDSLFNSTGTSSSSSSSSGGGGASGGGQLRRQLFLSTEDRQAVEFFQRTQYNVTTTKVDRRDRLDTISVHSHALRIGIDKELGNSFVALQLALQCDAFVGDMTSNWVRLIDELRATVRCKAHVPFVDPRQRVGVTDFNW